MSEVKIEVQSSPWDVRSLYDFQYFNCPECQFKVCEKQTFVDHAFDYHPDSVRYLDTIQDGSMVEVSIPWKIEVKEEATKNNFDPNDDKELVTCDVDLINEHDIDYDMSSDEEIPLAKKPRKKSKFLAKKATFDPKSEVQCYCCGLLISIEKVKVHIETIHGSYAIHMFGEPLAFQCHKCHATFENQGLCERHVCFDVFVPPKSTKTGKLKCEVCDHQIAKPTQYRKHYIAIHSNVDEKPFSCDQCDHKTKLAAWLHEHKFRKHSDKPHVCEECGQTFAYQSLLKIHTGQVSH